MFELYSSVAPVAVGVPPPKATVALFVDPAPPGAFLAVAKLVVVVQAKPSYSSALATGIVEGGTAPPKAKADVCIPAPPGNLLAVFRFPSAVQAEPLYSSFAVVGLGGGEPPKSSPAVNVPVPARSYLPVPKAPPVVQLVPSYFSVLSEGGVVPPNAKAAV